MSLLFALVACSGSEEPVEPPAPEVQEKIEPVADPEPPPGAETTYPATGQATVVTVKNGSIDVTGQFAHVEGGLQLTDSSWTGIGGTLSVRLDSWDSKDPVRDERVKRVFFEVAEDNATADFAVSSVEGVPEGGFVVGAEPVPVTLNGQLSLHGSTVDASFPVNVARPLEKAYVLSSTEPVALSIEAFGMGEQLQALITECAHESVDDAAKVTVYVELGEIPKEEPATEAPPPKTAPKDASLKTGAPLRKAGKTKAPGLKGQKGGPVKGKAKTGLGGTEKKASETSAEKKSTGGGERKGE